MRCQFCGWDNPESNKKCEKCGKTLVAENTKANTASPEAPAPAEERRSRPTDRRAGEAFSPKATVREREDLGQGTCPKCGYPLEKGKCAACGYGVEPDKAEPAPSPSGNLGFARATVRPVRKKDRKSFRLTPLSESNGTPEGAPLTFEGDSAMLNRGNLAPGNATITSHEQARVVLDDGHWYVEDKSELRTTFVQAARRVELCPGDIILMGDQLFRFDV